MKSIAIEVQNLKKMFKVFPYKFKLKDGNFVSYLDETYLRDSLNKLLEDNTKLLNSSVGGKITFQLHPNKEIVAVLVLENCDRPKFGDKYITVENGVYTYMCLEIVTKDKIKPRVISKYVIPSLDVSIMINGLNLDFDGITQVEVCTQDEDVPPTLFTL